MGHPISGNTLFQEIEDPTERSPFSQQAKTFACVPKIHENGLLGDTVHNSITLNLGNWFDKHKVPWRFDSNYDIAGKGENTYFNHRHSIQTCILSLNIFSS